MSSPLVETTATTTSSSPSPLIEASSDDINKIKNTFSSMLPTSLASPATTTDVQKNNNENVTSTISESEPTIAATTYDISNKIKDAFSSSPLVETTTTTSSSPSPLIETSSDDINNKIKDTFSSILPAALTSSSPPTITTDVENNKNENTESEATATDDISNKIKDTFATFSSMLPTSLPTTEAGEEGIEKTNNDLTNATEVATNIKDQITTNNMKKLLQRVEFQHNWNMQDNRNTNVDTTTKIENDNISTTTEIKDDKVHLEYTINLKLALDSQEVQLLKESLEALVLMKHIEMTDVFIITFGQMLPCVDNVIADINNNDATTTTMTSMLKSSSLSNNVGLRRFQYLLEKEAANYISAAEKEAAKYNIDINNIDINNINTDTAIDAIKDTLGETATIQIQQQLVRSSPPNDNDNTTVNPPINLEELEKNVLPMLFNQQEQNEISQDSSNNESSNTSTVPISNIMETYNTTQDKATTAINSLEEATNTTTDIYNKLLKNKSETSMKDVMENLGRSIVYDKIKLLIILFIIIGIIFTQPILICLKLEEKLPSNATWTLVLIPFWIFATMQLLFLIGWFIRSIKQESNNKEQQWYNFLSIVKFSCIYTFMILLSLKLDEVIAWKYIFILCPIYVYEFLWFVESVLNYILYQRRRARIDNNTEGRSTTTSSFKSVMYLLLKLTLHTIFLGLLVIQLDDLGAEYSWWVVFLPIWLVTFFILLDSCGTLCCSSGSNSTTATDDNNTDKEETDLENDLSQPLLMNEEDYQEQLEQIKEGNADEQENDKVIITMDDENNTQQGQEDENNAASESHVDIAVDFMNDGFTHYSSLGKACITCCCLFIIIIFLCLFVGYLQTGNDGNGSDYSSFWILFPFFFLAGIFLCCCCCILSCLPNVAPNEAAVHSLFDEAQDTTTNLKNQLERTIHEITA